MPVQPNPSPTIYFNHLTFPSLSFYRWAGRRQAGECDPDHAAGIMLAEILGPDMPKALLIETDGDIVVSAWGDNLAAADRSAKLHDAIPAAEIISREIAGQNLSGHLSFRLRCSPTRRRGNSEVDAYAAGSADRQGTRIGAYTAWLNQRLKGVNITHLVVARAGGKEIRLPGQKPFMKPSADLEGRLLVVDTGAFIQTLRKGVGRHGNLGFGTLILCRA